MRMAMVLGFSLVTGLVASAALAQSSCETQCNQQASACMKACTGDTKEAAKKENAGKLMECLKSCEAQARPCREGCKK